jgi:hypothetical protein
VNKVPEGYLLGYECYVSPWPCLSFHFKLYLLSSWVNLAARLKSDLSRMTKIISLTFANVVAIKGGLSMSLFNKPTWEPSSFYPPIHNYQIRPSVTRPKVTPAKTLLSLKAADQRRAIFFFFLKLSKTEINFDQYCRINDALDWDEVENVLNPPNSFNSNIHFLFQCCKTVAQWLNARLIILRSRVETNGLY